MCLARKVEDLLQVDLLYRVQGILIQTRFVHVRWQR